MNDLRHRDSRVENPVGFTSTQLLNVLGIKKAGNNYHEIVEWLQRMTLTGINSKGVVYLAGRKAWASDTFHVFDRVVAMGMELPDGRVADRNYVWLSDWQLENLNSNYLLPIDFDTYRQLRNNIAKALVPLLQVWLYASRQEGRFEKRYEDLCTLLNISRQKHPSLIKKQLGPSLDELQHHGYLASWRIELTSDGRDYKVGADHGPKFFRDQRTRALRGDVAEDAADRLVDQGERAADLPHLPALLARGLNASQARKLLRSLPATQAVQDILEYGDFLVQRSQGRISNPPGFYTFLLKENVQPPAKFPTSERRRQAADGAQAAMQETERRQRLELTYLEWYEQAVAQHVARMDLIAWQDRVQHKAAELQKTFPRLSDEQRTEVADRAARADLGRELRLPSLQEFSNSQLQGTLFGA